MIYTSSWLDTRSPHILFSQYIDTKLLPDKQIFIATQRTQAWLRFVMGFVFSTYIYLHGKYFDLVFSTFIVSILGYQFLNLISLFWIKAQPYSLTRILLMPIADSYLIMLAMWADAGQMSVVYVLLLSPIFGNGLRYGSFILRYCQVLSVIALVGICLINIYSLHIAIDWLGLITQLIGILYISIYGYNSIKNFELTSKAKLRAENSADRLIAEMPQPAFTYHVRAKNTPILYANPAMAMITSVSPTSLIGSPIAQLVIDEDKQALIDAALNVKGNTLRQCYVRLTNLQGKTIQVMCEMRRTLHLGQEIGLAYLTDISESERLQAELAEAQKQAQTAALAAGIAHDFRNLLSGIIGHAELIQMDHKDPQLQKDIRQIIKSGNQGSDMIEQLLMLGRSNPSNKKALDIGDSIQRMLQLARVQLPSNITLSISIEDQLPVVSVNLAQIEQILLNLVTNAAQSMSQQRGEINIKLSRHGDSPSYLCITIADNGCGIDPDCIKSIFKPFWSTRKGAGGTGLGLAMVQRILRWHDGHIDVESIPQQGTTFHLFLPEYIESQADQADTVPTLDVQTHRHDSNMFSWQVLLVEDQPDVMTIHSSFLSKMGHHVHKAENGFIALDILKHQPIDMVFTDYMMPEMDGITLTNAIRQQNNHLPVTLATAFSEDEALRQVASPTTIVMSKPITYKQLQAHIQMLQQQQTSPSMRDHHADS